jgi:hypothetical protein
MNIKKHAHAQRSASKRHIKPARTAVQSVLISGRLEE